MDDGDTEKLAILYRSGDLRCECTATSIRLYRSWRHAGHCGSGVAKDRRWSMDRRGVGASPSGVAIPPPMASDIVKDRPLTDAVAVDGSRVGDVLWSSRKKGAAGRDHASLPGWLAKASNRATAVGRSWGSSTSMLWMKRLSSGESGRRASSCAEVERWRGRRWPVAHWKRVAPRLYTSAARVGG